MRETSVLIVGGGPVGLALAVDLGWRGIDCILVEQTDGVIDQPKMDGVNVRTMEFCRRWGIVDALRACPYPKDYPQDMVYLTSIAGFELGREVFATPSGGAEERRLGHSPETRIRCPQTMFDPILGKFASSSEHVHLEYRHRFVEFMQDDDGVTATLEDLRNKHCFQVRARYLVACDGGNSAVRETLGIEREGQPVLTYSTNVVFRCPDIYSIYNKQLAYRHFFIGPEGTWGSMVAISGRDEWRLSITGVGEPRKLSVEEIHAAIRRALGADLPFEVLSAVPWVRRELVAKQFRSGRVFLAGDAAHVMSPTGGFGMNTGIADVADLGWKLEAAIRGWAGPGLLDSYDAERRPIAQRTVREATGNLLRTLSPGAQPGLLDNTREGAIKRYEFGRRFSATMLREWYKLGVDLGYVYEHSPICWPETQKPAAVPASATGERTSRLPDRFCDNTPVTPTALRERQRLCTHLAEGTRIDVSWTELPAEEVMVFRPSARPGARAPHVWLADGRSTLDLFGRAFTLLRLRPDAPDTEDLVQAAAARSLPLEIINCFEPDVYAAYGTALVLVRPDQHIAWRGDSFPVDGAAALIDHIRGASARLPQL